MRCESPPCRTRRRDRENARTKIAAIDLDPLYAGGVTADRLVVGPTSGQGATPLTAAGKGRRRVLMIGTYPIKDPRFGGPRRSRAIHDALAPVSVLRYIAVHPRNFRGARGRGDVEVAPQTQRRIDRQPFLADVVAGDAIVEDAAVRDRLRRELSTFRPEVILVEQLFPYLGLRALLDDLRWEGVLVYSSQNVEHQMKAEMYANLPIAAEERDLLVARLAAAEQDLSNRSDLVVAVSTGDAEVFRSLGATNVVIAGNGASPLQPSSSAIAAHRRRLSAIGAARTVVYVSSAHLPNWRGFLGTVGTRLGFLPTDSQLLICGSVVDLIEEPVSPELRDSATFWLCAKRIGSVSEESLAATVSTAGVIILPIKEGGGSNLKTAEALVSGRPIVATSFALRGYEDFSQSPGLVVTDTPSEFRAAIVDALALPAFPQNIEREVGALYWPTRLRKMVDFVSAL